MLLSQLSPGAADVDIAALAYDSRAVTPGALFFAVPGSRFDGHDLAADAIAAGAVALVVERPLALGVPELVVGSVRAAMAPLAVHFYGDPSAALRVVGVTGTNGKTTSAFLLAALLEASGERCGLLGTVKSVIGGREHPVIHTTPEAIDLQESLHAMLEAGDRACAMEVSSHALAQHRVDGTRFAAALFTNLTQDHLDFHATMEDYFAAKRRLFETQPRPRFSVVNVDDPYGRRLAAENTSAATYGLSVPADYGARELRFSISGAQFVASTPEGEFELRTRLPGRFNVLNVLGAIATVHALGVPLELIASTLPEVAPAPGRFQALDEGQPFTVLVDYAHTPDSLENVLRAARSLGAGRLLSVFGCGGDRDRGKRPQMGRISARLADLTIVTSDNPRSEDPGAIVEEILAGTASSSTVEAIVERAAAIEHAIELADRGDVVVIAGKGHEQGQEFAAGRKVPFDDAQVARAALRARA
jgi:UDP-N-acetylmuramoyl-L-alanyl-D-glutamate--2,6-diaminopimelate ligase